MVGGDGGVMVNMDDAMFEATPPRKERTKIFWLAETIKGTEYRDLNRPGSRGDSYT
jgi:hypothetical protein